jgi:ceramide glucosyltransferase
MMEGISTWKISLLPLSLSSLYKFHRKPPHASLKELPGISIIKPLTGIDGNLYENLKTFFNLQYPRVSVSYSRRSLMLACFQYEILFCVQEHDNDLLDMIDRLRTQYPHVESQLFVRKYYNYLRANRRQRTKRHST